MRRSAALPELLIRERLGFDGPLLFFDHHLAHAASAFFYSGWDSAAVLTVDGVGEWATTTYGLGQGAGLNIVEEVRFPHSLGLFYATLTAFLGFQVNSDEYKVMGLAAYGQPRYADRLWRVVEDPPAAVHAGYGVLRLCGWQDDVQSCAGRPAGPSAGSLAHQSRDFTRIWRPASSGCWRRCCCARCVACTSKPASADCAWPAAWRSTASPTAASAARGRSTTSSFSQRRAIPAAALAQPRWRTQLAGDPPFGAMTHAYWGPRFSCDDVARLVLATGAVAQDYRDSEPALLEAVVDRLVAGHIVGWFSGRMEFGPRALGARSILADPRDPGMRDRLNRLVKQREPFRPFAPAVLAEHASAHFDLSHPSPFMLETCAVRSPLDLPAITHVDHSARPQTVDAATQPRFAALIEAFYLRTGCPMLLNTSFNQAGEPIVCTPVDALFCFVNAGLDVLVLEDWLFDRAAMPANWPDLAADWNRDLPALAGAPSSPLGENLYTFV
ncbi:MAG: carbamoyltransferase C-terminal domain-containing protein [Caldilineales bacterium]